MATSTARVSLWQTIVGVIVIGGMVYGLYAILSSVWNFLASVDQPVRVTIITTFGTLLVAAGAVLSTVIGSNIQTRAIIKKDHREKKAPIYEKLIEFMSKAIRSQVNNEEIAEFAVKFNDELLVWGGDEVVVKWVKFRSSSMSGSEEDNIQLMLAYEEVIKAIRKDLGHTNKGVNQGDLLSTFVNGIHQHLPQGRKK